MTLLEETLERIKNFDKKTPSNDKLNDEKLKTYMEIIDSCFGLIISNGELLDYSQEELNKFTMMVSAATSAFSLFTSLVKETQKKIGENQA